MHGQQNFALISISPFDPTNYGYVFFSERLSFLEKNQKYSLFEITLMVIVSNALKAETFCFDWIHICSFWTLAQKTHINFIKFSLNTHSFCNSIKGIEKCYCIRSTTHNISIWMRVSLTKISFLAVFWT